MFNLAVCRLYDLGAVPNSIAGPWPRDTYPGWPAQLQPCSCMSNDANITIDGTTYYFRDFAGEGITTELDLLIKHYGTDCYVTAKGTPDCYNFPELCETTVTPY